jgi:hypothetical protein
MLIIPIQQELEMGTKSSNRRKGVRKMDSLLTEALICLMKRWISNTACL